MFSCRQVTRLISDRQDRSLSWFENACLHLHLLGCAPCCRFRRAVRLLHWALACIPSEDALPVPARQRIRLALERATQDE
jgi:hypothetical protein